MLVRYSEQEINLNEYCIFRTEIDVGVNYLDTQFYMDIDLMFSDLKDLEQTPQMIKENIQNPENEAVFECASFIHYKVNRMAYGMSEFIPIVTDKHFYAITGCTVHSTLIDYRFRVSSTIQNQIYGSKLLYLESGIQVKTQNSKKGKKNKRKTIQEEEDVNDPNPNYDHWVPKSAAEFLFCDESGIMAEQIDPEDADYLYNEYTNIIKGLFKKLSKSYNGFVRFAVKKKELLKKKAIPEKAPNLIPPGFHDKANKKEEQKVIQPEESKDSSYVNVNINSSQKSEDTKESTDEFSVEEEKVSTEKPIVLNPKSHHESNKDKFEEEYSKLQRQNQQFSKRVNLKNPGEVATKLLMEVNEYSCQLFSLWNDYIQLLMVDQNETVKFFSLPYHKLTYERWLESIFRDINIVEEFYECSDSNKVGEKHTKIANKQRNSNHYQNLTPLPIEDTSMFPNWADHPILFEELYIKDKERFEQEEAKRNDVQLSQLVERNKNESHLIILVHGFQGNSEDLRLLRNNILAIYPSAIFLSSTCNENESDGNIEDQGMKLANEVTNYIENYFELDEIKRISFIGHSLGGVIIRAAMQFLEELRDKFYTFMTLSSPHLGYLYSPKFLISAGMWVLKKWKKSDSLKELTLSDSSDVEESYIYRLSMVSKLEWFKNILLVSSYQDSYVAFESARIQFRKDKGSKSSAKNETFEKMAKNLLGEVPVNHIHRLDVNFKIQEKNLDSFIGRSAHIRFLENQPLIRMIVNRYAEFFA